MEYTGLQWDQKEITSIDDVQVGSVLEPKELESATGRKLLSGYGIVVAISKYPEDSHPAIAGKWSIEVLTDFGNNIRLSESELVAAYRHIGTDCPEQRLMQQILRLQEQLIVEIRRGEEEE